MIKKFVTLLAIAGMAFGACNKLDIQEPAANYDEVKAVLEESADATRTSMNGAQVVWNDGDKISVFSHGSIYYNNEGILKSGANSTNATFKVIWQGTSKVAALYPYQESASYDGTKISLEMPASYTYSENNISGSAMAGKFASNNSPVAFKNAGAMVELTVNNIPAGYNKAIMTSVGDQNVAGDAEIVFDADGVPTLTTSSTEGAKTVTISFASSSQPSNKTFYFPLPIDAYERLVFEISNGSESEVLKKVNNLAAKRNQCYTAEITLDEVVGNTPVEVVGADQATEALKNGNSAVNVTIPDDDNDQTEISLPKNDTPTSSTSLTFASIPSGKVVEISESSEGTGQVSQDVTISVSSDETSQNDFNITLPESTVTLNTTGETAVYNNVTAHTSANTLVIGAGVTVKNLTVVGGNVRVHGKVASLVRDSENAESCTFIYVEEGAEIPQGLNDDFIIVQEGTVTVSTLNGFISALMNANVSQIKLAENIVSSDILTINRSVILDLNGKVMEGKGTRFIRVQSNGSPVDVTIKNGTVLNQVKDGRCVETRSGDVHLTLNKVTLSTPVTGADQPLTVGGSGKNIVVDIVNGSKISTNKVSGYAITTFNPVTMNIENSEVEGWCALNVKVASGSLGSAGSVFNVKSSKLTGANAVSEGESNGFTTIMIEDKNVTVNVDANSTVVANAENANRQALVTIGNSLVEPGNITGTKVTFADGANLVLSGDKSAPLSIASGEKIEGNSFKFSKLFATDVLAKYGWDFKVVEGGLVEVIGRVEVVSTLDDLTSALMNANVSQIKLAENIVSSDILTINRSVILDLNGKVMEGKGTRFIRVQSNGSPVDVTIKNGTVLNQVKDGRCVETRSGDVHLTLNKVTLSTPVTGADQPLTVGGSGKNIVVDIVNGSKISTNKVSGYAITTFNPVTMNIENSEVEGWCALNVKVASGSLGSAGSVFNVKSSKLTGANAVSEGESNGFTTIMIEDKNVTVNVDANSTVVANAENANRQALVTIGNSLVEPGNITGTKVTFADGANLVLSGDKSAPLSIASGEKIEGNSFKYPESFASILSKYNWTYVEVEGGLVEVTGITK